MTSACILNRHTTPDTTILPFWDQLLQPKFERKSYDSLERSANPSSWSISSDTSPVNQAVLNTIFQQVGSMLFYFSKRNVWWTTAGWVNGLSYPPDIDKQSMALLWGHSANNGSIKIKGNGLGIAILKWTVILHNLVATQGATIAVLCPALDSFIKRRFYQRFSVLSRNVCRLAPLWRLFNVFILCVDYQLGRQRAVKGRLMARWWSQGWIEEKWPQDMFYWLPTAALSHSASL